jgi:dihydroneopterin aldolase
MNPDTLTLSRLRFFGHHGVLPEEAARGQDFEVTVQLELPLDQAGQTDDLGRTVDYREVREVVRGVMEGPPRKLVEALAEGLAAAILRGFPLVQAVEIEVIKPKPPVGFVSSGLAVRIRRARRNGEPAKPENREAGKP